jgi:8-oxo-dGTP diphosphatase
MVAHPRSRNNRTPFIVEEIKGDLSEVLKARQQLRALNEIAGRTCSKCKKATRIEVDKDCLRLKCIDQKKCKWIVWNSPMPVAAGVVLVPSEYTATTDFTGMEDYDTLDAESIVLVRRKNDPFAGSWALPGGYINPFEGPRQAGRREVLEETTLDTETILNLGACNPLPEHINIVTHYALQRVRGGILEARDDAAEVAIFSLDQLPEIPFSSHVYSINKVKSIQDIRRRLRWELGREKGDEVFSSMSNLF